MTKKKPSAKSENTKSEPTTDQALDFTVDSLDKSLVEKELLQDSIVKDSLSFQLTILIPKKDILFKKQKSKKAKISVLNRVCIGEILASLPSKHQKHVSLGETLLEQDEFWGIEVSALALDVSKKNERAAKILACLYSLGEVFRLSKNGRFKLHISST